MPPRGHSFRSLRNVFGRKPSARFTKAGIAQLTAYIAELQAEQAGTPTRGAIWFAF